MQLRFLNSLSKFDISQISQGLFVRWDDIHNKWVLPSSQIDPLSSILMVEQPIPYLRKNDDVVISTLSKVLDRKVSWIQSFQDGWVGIDNRHTSITGYLLGSELKKKYFP